MKLLTFIPIIGIIFAIIHISNFDFDKSENSFYNWIWINGIFQALCVTLITGLI